MEKKNVVYIRKEILDELNRFIERHIPVIPFNAIKGNYYPRDPLTQSSISKLTDIDLRNLKVAGKGRIYSQYLCKSSSSDSNAEVIRKNKFGSEKIIKKAVFVPAPNSIDLTEYFNSNLHLSKNLKYSSGCYHCKKSITDNSPLCEDCNRYYMCSNCGYCLCDKSKNLLG